MMTIIKKNIGILTFHRAYNYGARLQCYALSHYLQTKGCNVKIIDYYPSYFKDEYSIIPFKRIRQAAFLTKLAIAIDTFLHLPFNILRRRKFDGFLSLLPLSDLLNTFSSTYGDYDIVFVGSDQVWNRELTGGKSDPLFTGELAHDGIKLVSYAASTKCDHNSIVSQSEYYCNTLKNFDMVSVREDVLCDFCNTLIPDSTITVADPVLLLDRLEWSKIAIRPKENKYVLVYTVPSDPSVMKIAKIVAASKGLKIIELVPRVKYVYKRNARQIASPQEFLGYFMNASYVVTTSFHGTAFSIIFRKQFSTILLGSNVDNRSLNLLNKLELNTRTISSKDIKLPINDIDYSQTERLLNNFRNTSIQFLERAIL